MRRNTKVVPIFRSRVDLAGIPYTTQTGVPMAGSVNGNGSLWVAIDTTTPGGSSVGQLTTAPDNVDGQVVTTINSDLLTQARGFLFNGTSWDRFRSADATNIALLSGLGVALVSGPGNWAINHTPAATTQATISRAAGGAGVRHVCTSVSFSLGAIAAEGSILVNLRDGATGVGTILQSWRLGPLVIGTSAIFELSGLNIVGSANTAMTLEFAAAPTAGNFETVALTGYDAS